MFEGSYQFAFFDGAESCFASLTCTCLQCRAKSKDGGKVLRDKLERIGMQLPSGGHESIS